MWASRSHCPRVLVTRINLRVLHQPFSTQTLLKTFEAKNRFNRGNNFKPLVINIVVALLFCLMSVDSATAQRRQRRPPSKPAIDYSKFLHSTTKHKQPCNTCHKVPTKNWQAVRDYPDVADYPDHDACVSCHRPQFFRGDRPVICTSCHTQSAPRAEARLAFRNPKTQRQFLIEFPHDKHQDVIAYKREQNSSRHEGILFRRVSFQTPAANQAVDPYNNCTICHEAKSTLPSVTWPDGFLPDTLTFKDVPTKHSACFNCHWQAQVPTRQNCDGCHKLAPGENATTALIDRISLKFKHDGGGEKKNHVAECTTCHINITKSVSLRGLKPDVPITSCTECHNKDGLRLDLSKELVQIDKNRDFVCIYCHTSNVGRLDPPASHYLIAERPPLKRQEIK